MATWEGDDSMTDSEKLIQEFGEACAQEGLDYNDRSTLLLLLKEAVDGGWKDRIAAE